MRTDRRMQYIDAMRGMAILCVVYHHFIVMGMRDTGYVSPVNNIIMIFFMPLFFFISGYVSNRRFHEIAFPQFVSLIKKKAMKLLVPFIFAYLLCMAYFNLNPLQWITDSYKCGYWFTWVLFWIVMIDAVCEKVLTKKWLVFLFAVVAYFGSFLLHDSNFLVGFFSADFVFANLIYYVLGIALRQEEQKIQHILTNQFVSLLLLTIAILPCAFNLPWSMVGSVICKIAYLLILFILFKHFSAKFEEQKISLQRDCAALEEIHCQYISFIISFCSR